MLKELSLWIFRIQIFPHVILILLLIITLVGCPSLSAQQYVPYRIGSKWGISDKQGNLTQPAIWNFISPTENGNFIVTGDSAQSMLIDFQGNIIYKASDGEIIDGFQSGVIRTCITNPHTSYVAYVILSKKKILHTKYSCECASDFKYGYVIVSRSCFKKGVIRDDGKRIIKLKYNDIITIDSMFIVVKKKEQLSIYNVLNGKRVCKFSTAGYKNSKEFSDFGKKITLKQFVEIQKAIESYFSKSIQSLKLIDSIPSNVHYIDSLEFSAPSIKYSYLKGVKRVGVDLFIAQYNKKFGLINSVGTCLVEFKYDEIRETYGELFLVRFQGQFGYIDESGREYWHND